MHVSTGATLGRVHVRVGVDPDHPQFLPSLAEMLGDSGGRADRDGGMAAENDRELAGTQHIPHHFGQAGTSFSNLRKISRFWGAFRLTLALNHRDIAEGFDYIAEACQTPVEIGHANRRWTHIHAPASRSQIERCPDDCNM